MRNSAGSIVLVNKKKTGANIFAPVDTVSKVLEVLRQDAAGLERSPNRIGCGVSIQGLGRSDGAIC